jgi:hypothetical protein
MEQPQRRRGWWVPGLLTGLVGVIFLVAGLRTGGPEAVDGIVFGGLFLVAAAVILWRRARPR